MDCSKVCPRPAPFLSGGGFLQAFLRLLDSRFFVVPDVQMNPPKLYDAAGKIAAGLNEKVTALGFVRGGRALVTLGEAGVQVWGVR